MLKEGTYIAENNNSIFDEYKIKVKVKETEKSFILELIDLKSRYNAVHIETLFTKSKRFIMNKKKGGHAIRIWGQNSFTFYPYQAGVPYYFELFESLNQVASTICKGEVDAVNAMALKHEHLTLKDENYIIRPFKDWNDFLEEGRGYCSDIHDFVLKRYIIGTAYLFAMRNADEPDVPYMFLEFDVDGNLKQVREQGDGSVDKTAAHYFIKQFRKNVLKPYILEQKKMEEAIW